MKLVVSDVDGTLLRAKEQIVSQTVIAMIKELTKKGILFAAASGRCYSDLVRIFQEVKEEILFIASDGAVVVYKGTVLCCFPIDHALGFEFLKDIYQYTKAEVVLYGKERTYIIPKEQEFREIISGLGEVQVVSCMNRVQEEYLKIACYYKENIETQLKEYLPYWREKFHIPYCSREWIEFTACGVHKATAVEKILELFHIKKEELLVFGDNENDRELLSFAEFAYVMKKAKAEIKQLCAYETEDVVETIRYLCLKE